MKKLGEVLPDTRVTDVCGSAQKMSVKKAACFVALPAAVHLFVNVWSSTCSNTHAMRTVHCLTHFDKQVHSSNQSDKASGLFHAHFLRTPTDIGTLVSGKTSPSFFTTSSKLLQLLFCATVIERAVNRGIRLSSENFPASSLPTTMAGKPHSIDVGRLRPGSFFAFKSPLPPKSRRRCQNLPSK